MSFSGIIPAVITPFTEADQVDTDALTANVAFLVEHGACGFVANGTMGEGSSLSNDERRLVIETVVAAAGDRPVLAGVSASSTAVATYHATVACEAGCAGVMCLPPINYGGTLAELVAFFADVADAAQLPVMLYNNPEASGTDLSAETITHIIGAVPAITSVKECSGDARRIAAIRERADVNVLVGGDDYVLEGYAAGADGWVTGTGNVVPRECVDLQEHVRAGRLGEARELYVRLLPLLRLDMTPHLVQYYKGAMDSLGLHGGPVRPPRLPLDAEHQNLLDAALDALAVSSAV
jgi:4-hydroxy-tetrahydrodipicolinate synthase